MIRWTITVLTVPLLAVWLASGRWFVSWTDIQPAGSMSTFVGVGVGRLCFGRTADPIRLAENEPGWKIGARSGGYGLGWGFPKKMTPNLWAMPLWVPVLLTATAAGWAWFRRLRPRRRRADPLGWAAWARRTFEGTTLLLLAAWLVSAWWTATCRVPMPGRGHGVFGFGHGLVGIGVTADPSLSTEVEYLGFGLDWWFRWNVETIYVPSTRILVIPIWALILLTGGAAAFLRIGHMRRVRRMNVCSACGYDLSGLPPDEKGGEPTCPECGPAPTSTGQTRPT